MRCYGLGRRRNFVKGIVLLRPECRAVGIVQAVDISAEFIAQKLPKSRNALRAIAYVAALVTELVVRLPGDYRTLVLLVSDKTSDNPLRIVVHDGRVEAIYMPAAEGALSAVLKLRED